jgi:hypothetical protein
VDPDEINQHTDRPGPRRWRSGALVDQDSYDLSTGSATRLTEDDFYNRDPDVSPDANPEQDFRFDAALGASGGYIYNLGFRGLSAGTWTLQFTASGDPVAHGVQFDLRWAFRGEVDACHLHSGVLPHEDGPRLPLRNSGHQHPVVLGVCRR